MPTPADELRAAAEKLRALAAAVEADVETNPYWWSELTQRPDWYANGVRNGLGGPSGELSAAMHPGVGAALAPLLERQARIAAETQDFLGDEFQDGALDQNVHDALAVARQILGTAP